MNPIWRAFETQPNRAALAHPGDGTAPRPRLALPVTGRIDIIRKARAFLGGLI